MTRNEFVFSIGFQGNSPIVDVRAMGQYGRLDTLELARRGLFRCALASAVYSGDPGEEKAVLAEFERQHAPALAAGGKSSALTRDIHRLIGVYEVPGDIKKVIRV